MCVCIKRIEKSSMKVVKKHVNPMPGLRVNKTQDLTKLRLKVNRSIAQARPKSMRTLDALKHEQDFH